MSAILDSKGRLYDDNGIDLGEHAATAAPIAPRPAGIWDHNGDDTYGDREVLRDLADECRTAALLMRQTVARAQRDADAPVVALVAKYPERLAFIAGKLALLKVKA